MQAIHLLYKSGYTIRILFETNIIKRPYVNKKVPFKRLNYNSTKFQSSIISILHIIIKTIYSPFAIKKFMAYSISRTRSSACRTNSEHGVKNILYTFDTLCAQREQN